MIGKDFQIHLSAVTVARPSPRPRRRSDLVHIVVDQIVWQTALKLADGDSTRLEVVSATEVIVHNKNRR